MPQDTFQLQFSDSQYSQPLTGPDGHTYRVRRERLEDAEQELTYATGQQFHFKRTPDVIPGFVVKEEYAYTLFDLNAQQWVTPYLMLGAMLIVLRNRGMI